MPYIKVTDIKNINNGGAYLEIDFWPNKVAFLAGNPPQCSESFIKPHLDPDIMVASIIKHPTESSIRVQIGDRQQWMDIEQFFTLPPEEQPVLVREAPAPIDYEAIIFADAINFYEKWTASQSTDNPWPSVMTLKTKDQKDYYGVSDSQHIKFTQTKGKEYDSDTAILLG